MTPSPGEPATVEIVELRPDALAAATRLVARIWGSPPDRPLVEPNTLRAMALAGEQLLGVYPAGRVHDPAALLGVSIAFVGTHPGGIHLHSHVTGIDPAHQHAGLGFRLKCAQRAWALARGITQVRWTFDPLIARNAAFNLTRLGAVGVAYHENLYGALPDATNAGDESDRVEAHWDLTAPVGRAAPDVARERAAGAPAILDLGPDGRPQPAPLPSPAPEAVLARVPPDIVAIRRADPDRARAWRRAARATIGAAIAAGLRATGATADGWWVLERVGTDAR